MPSQVIADGWYAWGSDRLLAFTDWLERRSPRLNRLAWRFGWLRGLLLFAASTRHAALAVIYRDRGWRSLLLLRACLGFERKLVVLHLIEKDARRGRTAGLIDRAWALVERPAMRRAVRDAQVLSCWERTLYAERFGLPMERLHYLPFAWRISEMESLPPHEGRGVVSAGRVSCDWPTLFAASRDTTWPLVVVCTASDLPCVERLNSDGRATVRCDLPRADALALLEGADIVALCMWESGRSQGHVRLCQATEAGGRGKRRAQLRRLRGPGRDGRDRPARGRDAAPSRDRPPAGGPNAA